MWKGGHQNCATVLADCDDDGDDGDVAVDRAGVRLFPGVGDAQREHRRTQRLQVHRTQRLQRRHPGQFVTPSVYNVVITCAAGVPVSLLVGDRPDSAFLIIALFVLFSTTTTVALVFGPKVHTLARHMPLSCACLSVCLSVHLSVTSRRCVETTGRIELGFGMEAFFRLSYTVL